MFNWVKKILSWRFCFHVLHEFKVKDNGDVICTKCEKIMNPIDRVI